MTLKQSCIAGSFAGFVNSFVVSPIELVKSRLQIQTERDANQRYYKSTMHCIRLIIKEEGVLALNNGMVTTILREVPCYAVQFASYHYLKRAWATFVERCPEKKVSQFGCFVAGGLAGLCSWVF